jgi:hypothetical protein
MRPIRFQRLARWVAGALMLLLVDGLGAPGSAWAGCNHLVTSRSDRSLDFNRLDTLLLVDSAAELSHEEAQDPLGQGPQRPKRRLPCSGPGCSGRAPLPVSTAALEREGFDQWGALSARAMLPIESPPGRTIDEPAPRLSEPADPIFHPPRS